MIDYATLTIKGNEAPENFAKIMQLLWTKFNLYKFYKLGSRKF